MPDRAPANPIPLPPSGVHARLVNPPLDEKVARRLEDVCGSVQRASSALLEASRDWWPLAMVWARQGEVLAEPAAVVRPSSVDEVSAVLSICNDALVPVTAAAGRSGVCGAAIPVFGGVVLDMTGLAGITEFDDEALLCEVRAGTWGDGFEAALRSEHLATLGHWPQSIELSTVGGWVACRSAGQYSTRYGKIEDMVAGLEVVLADGSVVRTGGTGARAATGPDLTQLFTGSEGTLGVVTSAVFRVRPVPPAQAKAAYVFPSFAAGLAACRTMLRRGATPAVLRLYDHRESRRSFEIDGNALIVFDEADQAIADATMTIVEDEASRAGGERQSEAHVDRWFAHRNDVSGLAEAVNRDVVVDTCEVAGRWSVLPDLYERAVAAVKAVDGAWVCSAHQSHAYTDGACLYFTFAGQREGDPDGFYVDAWDAITRAAREAGGAISHHHGIGLNRGRFLRDALGPAFDSLVSVKRALDPSGILNPGKLGLPSPFGSDVPWP